MTNVPKGTDMLRPIPDEVFERMTANYPPAVKANKRAGLDFLQTLMGLSAPDAAKCLIQMKKTIDGIGQNLALLAMAQSLSKEPADITRPIGELLNEILRKKEADESLLEPKSKAEHESRNFATVH